MKVALYVLSAVVFLLNIASCVLSNPTSEATTSEVIICAIFLLISAVLFSSAAVIGAIESHAKNAAKDSKQPESNRVTSRG